MRKLLLKMSAIFQIVSHDIWMPCIVSHLLRLMSIWACRRKNPKTIYMRSKHNIHMRWTAPDKMIYSVSVLCSRSKKTHIFKQSDRNYFALFQADKQTDKHTKKYKTENTLSNFDEFFLWFIGAVQSHGTTLALCAFSVRWRECVTW